MALRAVVIGSGWAGDGHVAGLRAAGAEVVALCGRAAEVVKAKADQWGIESARSDWRQALADLRPDIVSIATTAPPHREMVEYAAQLGAHIVCEKPLGLNADEAQAMLLAVERAGVKHGYGATNRYTPTCFFAHQLLAKGLIGQVREIEFMIHVHGSDHAPYTWINSLELGGGLLYNIGTHMMSIICFIAQAEIVAAAGEAKRLQLRAPVGPSFHDLRETFGKVVEIDQTTEWREVTADSAYTVVVQLQMPQGGTASAMLKGSTRATARAGTYVAFYGERGTLHLTASVIAPNAMAHYDLATQQWRDLTPPPKFLAAYPQLENVEQSNWNIFFREFVADIRGEGATVYPTFRDGWIHNQVIDIARSGRSWTPIRLRPEA